jgi:hypothetical protein
MSVKKVRLTALPDDPESAIRHPPFQGWPPGADLG